MVEKIERIARVKGIESESDKRFNRKNGRNDDGDRKKFESTLNAAIKRKTELETRTNDAAHLELRNMPLHSIATHSLFYSMHSLDELLTYAE